MSWGVALEKQRSDLMMMKFGRLVDLEALQMLSGNKITEELKRQKILQDAEHAENLREWDVGSPVCVCECSSCFNQLSTQSDLCLCVILRRR